MSMTTTLVNFGEWLDSQRLLSVTPQWPADVPIEELVEAFLDDETF